MLLSLGNGLEIAACVVTLRSQTVVNTYKQITLELFGILYKYIRTPVLLPRLVPTGKTNIVLALNVECPCLYCLLVFDIKLG